MRERERERQREGPGGNDCWIWAEGYATRNARRKLTQGQILISISVTTIFFHEQQDSNPLPSEQGNGQTEGCRRGRLAGRAGRPGWEHKGKRWVTAALSNDTACPTADRDSTHKVCLVLPLSIVLTNVLLPGSAYEQSIRLSLGSPYDKRFTSCGCWAGRWVCVPSCWPCSRSVENRYHPKHLPKGF